MAKPDSNRLEFLAAVGLLAAAAGLLVPSGREPAGRAGDFAEGRRLIGFQSAHQSDSQPPRFSRFSGNVPSTKAGPQQAGQEAAAFPASKERDEAVLSAAAEWVRTDYNKAIKLAVPLPALATRDEVLERAVREWAVSDPEAAITYAKSIPDEALRERFHAAALIEWSGSHPAAAATAAANELREGRIQENAVTSIAMRWFQQDPGAVAAWIGRFPEGDLKQSMVESITSIAVRNRTAEPFSSALNLRPNTISPEDPPTITEKP